MGKRKGTSSFYYGWVIVAVIALAGFTQTAQTFPVWGVLLKPITEDMGWSRTIFSGAMGVGTLMGAVLAVMAAPTLDRFGARWPMVTGFAVIGLTLVLMAWMNDIWQFYVLLVIGRTIHLGVVSIGQESTIPKWFIAKRGTAVGIGASGNRIGSTITPLYAQAIITLAGWRPSLVVIGIVVWLASMLPVALFLRSRPEDMGMRPDGIPIRDENEPETRPNSAKIPDIRDLSFTRAEALRLRSFYSFMFVNTILFIVVPTTSLHFVPFLTDLGMSPEVSVGAVALSAAVGIPGSVLVGAISDRFGSKRTAIASFIIFASMFVLAPFIDSAFSAYAWGVGYGLGLVGTMTTTQILMADYFGHKYLAGIRSLIMPVRSLGQAIGPVLAGLVYDTTGGYGPIFISFVVLNLAGAGLIFTAKRPERPSQAK